MTDPQEPQDYDGSSGQVTRSNSTDSSFDYHETQPKSDPVYGVSTPTSGSSQHATPGLSYPQPRADSTNEYPTLTSGYPLQSPLGSMHSVPLTPWPYPYNNATPITTSSTYGTGLYHINTGSSHPPHSAGTGLAPGSGAWSNVYFGAAPHTAIGLGSGTFGNPNTGQMYGGMDGLPSGGMGATSGFGAGAATGLESGIEQAYTGLSPLFAGSTTSPITPFSAQHVRPALPSLTSVSSSNTTSSTSTDGSWVTARKRSSTMQTLESAASASPATPSSYQAHDYLSFIPNLPSRDARGSQESNQMESLRSSFSSFSSLSNLDQSQSTPATPFSHPHPYAYTSRSSGSSTSTGTLGAHRTPHSAHPDNHGSGSTGVPQLIRHPSAPSMFSMAMTRHRVHPTSTPSAVRRVIPPRIDLSAGIGSDDWWAKEGEGRSASSGLGGFGQRDSMDKAPRFKPTKEQQAMLIGSYNENKNPGTEARARLAKAISSVGPETSQKTVQIWFQNRRAKERSLNLPKSAVRSRSTTVDSSVDLETLRALTRDDSPDLHLVPLSVLCVGTWTRFLTPGNGMLNPDLGAAIAFDNDPRLMLYVVHKAETFRISIALQRDNVTQLEVAAQSNLHINTDAVAVRFVLKAGTAVFASWKRGNTERSEVSAGVASGGVSVGGMSAGGTMVDMSGAFSGEMDGGERRQSDGTRGTGDYGRWTPVDDFTGGEASKGGRGELTGEKETLLPGFARIQAWLQSGSSGKMDGGEVEMNGGDQGGTDFGSWRFPEHQPQTQATAQDMQMGGQGHYFGHAQAPDQSQPQPQYQHDSHQLHSQTDQSSSGTSWPGSFSPGSGFSLDSSTPISATSYNPANMFAGYYTTQPDISPGQAYSHSSVSTDSPDLSPSEMGYRQRAISAPVPMQLGVDHAFGAHALGEGNSQSPQQHFSPEPTGKWMETGSSLGFGDLTTPKSGQFGEVFKREREHPRPTTVESQSTSSTPAPYTASNSNSNSTTISTSTSSSTPVSSSKAGATNSDAISRPTSARQEGQDGVMW